MNEPSDMSDTSARPQDYAGLRAELTELAGNFTPVNHGAMASSRGPQVPLGIAWLWAT
jgi:hypothetical protein